MTSLRGMGFLKKGHYRLFAIVIDVSKVHLDFFLLIKEASSTSLDTVSGHIVKLTILRKTDYLTLCGQWDSGHGREKVNLSKRRVSACFYKMCL